MDYSFFLFSMLYREVVDSDSEHDAAFERIKELYDQYMTIHIEDPNKSDHDNMVEFLKKERPALLVISHDRFRSELKAAGYIPVLWTWQDVRDVAKSKHIHIGGRHIAKVVDYIVENHDANVGITWGVISDAIDNVIK